MATALGRLLLFALLVACSGGDEKKEDTTPAGGQPAADPAEAERVEKLRKLRAAQDSAVEAMCERLVDCQVEDLKNASEEEKRQVGNVEELIPKARAECEAQAGESDLSPRQVKIIQGCVNEAKTCEELVTCLEQAQKSS